MTGHALFGICGNLPSEAAIAIGRQLGCVFEQRESHYTGDYWTAKIGSTMVKIITQPDSYGDPVESEFPSYRTLVYADGDQSNIQIEGVIVGGCSVERLRTT
ncbi:hypothetical protein ACFWOG_05470 [Kitasatospora sp. NPDC058406]|uniref:hypothetical protein n=1 Tax=Kitasatospora sp. NPDC058406 TaxID=3346483 RepID=UPI00365DEF69